MWVYMCVSMCECMCVSVCIVGLRCVCVGMRVVESITLVDYDIIVNHIM